MRNKIRATIAGVAAAGLFGAGAVAFTAPSRPAPTNGGLKPRSGAPTAPASAPSRSRTTATRTTRPSPSGYARPPRSRRSTASTSTPTTRRRTVTAASRIRPSRRRRGSSPPTATGRRTRPSCTATTPVTCRACSSTRTERRRSGSSWTSSRRGRFVGRAVVLHAGPDNFGNVPVGTGADQYIAGATALAKTQATGNAGDRFGCGVIRRD